MNNGIAEYISNKEQEIYNNKITVDIYGNSYYREYKFKCDDNIIVLGNDKFNSSIGHFLATCIEKEVGHYNFGQQFRKKHLMETEIFIPLNKNNEIDFEFMLKFIKEIEEEKIKEIEEEKIKEIETYLKVTGLYNYELTKKEKEAINKFNKTQRMGVYTIDELFIGSSGDTDIQKKNINKRGIKVITAGLSNFGILGKSSIKSKIFNKNTLTVDMFGNTVYRNFEYKMVTHGRVFSLDSIFSFKKDHLLYCSSLLSKKNKSYSYAYMCSWNKLKKETIELPITNNNEIDFEYMEIFISAIQKLVIKDLVLYSNEKVKQYKKFSCVGDTM